MTERKPDYVFNVWADGALTRSLYPEVTAKEWVASDKEKRRAGTTAECIAYRICVYLKNKDDKK